MDGIDVFRQVQAQQAQLDVLCARLLLMKDEHEALCDCLVESGAVPTQRLLSCLHRRRFASVLRRHPCGTHESLEALLQAKELVLNIAAPAGLAGLGALGAASHTLRTAVAASAPEIVSLFPVTLYAAGGEANGVALASVERFDAATNRWMPEVPLTMQRSGCAAVALGQHVYVVGGCSAGGEDLSSVERLSLEHKAWEVLPPMHAGRDELAAAAADGRVYVTGGSCLVWPVRHVIDAVECFDPALHCWELLPSLSRERCAAAAISVGRQVFVLGGCDEDGNALDSAEQYLAGTPAWLPVPAMRRARCNFAAASLGGYIYVAGGYDDRMRDLDAVERYDPVSLAWENVAALTVPRWGARAVGRAGAVFVVGGQAREEEVGAADRLDPASGAWTALAPLQQARRSFGLAASYYRQYLKPAHHSLLPIG